MWWWNGGSKASGTQVAPEKVIRRYGFWQNSKEKHAGTKTATNENKGSKITKTNRINMQMILIEMTIRQQ